MRKIIDEKKILIMNISKGRIGEDNSRLLGALLITKLQLAAMSRVDVPEEKREDFFLYVDEFQNFATKAFVNILSEARKYRLCLTLSNQYIAQLEEMTPTGKSADVRDAIFGNVGTIVVFRVGAEDAEFLEKEFTPEFIAGDLVNLPKYNIDLKLMIDGVAGSAFSAETLPPFPKSEESNREKIIKASRERYSVLKKIVEEKITKWLGALKSPEVPLEESRQVLYDAKCSLCGKWTKVTFEPDASRPIYCKTCLKKVRPAKPNETGVENEKRDFSEKKKTSPVFSLQEAVGREPISFFGKREVKKTKEEKKTKRKEVNLEELKKTLEESLKGMETKKDEPR